MRTSEAERWLSYYREMSRIWQVRAERVSLRLQRTVVGYTLAIIVGMVVWALSDGRLP